MPLSRVASSIQCFWLLQLSILRGFFYSENIAKRLADAEKSPDTKAELPGIRLSDSYPVQSQAVSSTKSPTLDNNT